MKILLINPPGWQKGSTNLGLSYLAAGLLKNGHEVLILDVNASDEPPEAVAAQALAFTPDIAGVSIKTATAKEGYLVLKAVKDALPGAVYVVGGPHVTLAYKEVLGENPWVDYAFIGESDLSFIEFVQRLAANKAVDDIPGLAFRKGAEIVVTQREYIENVDALPFPSFEAIKNYNFTDFRYPMITSRGCPYPCTYCCVGVVSSKKWRARTPENIIEELKAAKARFKMDKFEILDDNFTLNVDRAKKFCRLLLENKLNLSWWCHNGIRADKIDLELAQLMKASGCTSVALGVESGDEKIFDSIKKGEKLEAIVNAVKMLKQAGLKAVGYFIIGLPGDSLEGIKKTIKFQQSLGLDHFTYGVLNPYPYTEVYDVIKREGKMLLDIKDASHFASDLRIPFEMPGFSKADMTTAYYLAKYQQIYQVLEAFKAKRGRDPERVLYVDFRAGSKFIENLSRISGNCELDVFAFQWHSDDYIKNKSEYKIENLYIYSDVPHTFGRVRRFLEFFFKFRARKYDIAFYNIDMPKLILPAFLAVTRPKEFYFEAQNGEKFIKLLGKEVRDSFKAKLRGVINKVKSKPYILITVPAIFALRIIGNILYRPLVLGFGLFLLFKRSGRVMATDGKSLIRAENREDLKK